MEAAFQSAFASNVLKTFWKPVFDAIGGELQKVKDMDEALRKLETCREEALDLLHKVDPSCRREADKLAKFCHEADDLIEVIEHEIKNLKPPTSSSVRGILISPKNWAKPHKIDELHKKMAILIDHLRKHIDLSQEIQLPLTESPLLSEIPINKKLKFIGRELDVRVIVEELTSWETYGSFGVSIVGMRGLGKTALADHILHHEEVQAKFPLILRASMSGGNFCKEDLESRLCVVHSKRFCSRKRMRSENSSHHLLDSDKWLLMLDSVGEVPSNAWRDFQTSYQTIGRKILITTLSARVGKMTRTTVHYLKPLSEKHSEELVQHEYTLSCNSILPQPSMVRALAKISCGLPLVATFLVWSLPSIEEGDQWIHEDIWKWPKFRIEILPILQSSFMGLETKLKRCFVYFSLFPHDYQFCKEELIHLWISERLVLPHDSRFEKNGQDFFNELLDRSVIQSQTGDNRTLTRYEMHKFTHEFAQIPGSKTYVRMGVECTFSPENWNKYTCHLSLSCDKQLQLCDDIGKHLRHLRTLLLLPDRRQAGQIGKIPHDFFKKFCGIRVLVLNKIHITDLPRSIKMLKYLRHLDISHTNIMKLPEKLANISTLQILKLSAGLDFPELPTNFNMLTNLSFVDWKESHIQKLVSKPRNIGNLVNLRTLPLFIVGNKKGYCITELKSMNHIEGSLKISNLQNVTGEAEAREAMLSHKSSLQRLELIWTKNASNAERVLIGLQPHNQLKELKIVNYSSVTFPSWLCNDVTRLQKLELVGCQSCCNLPAIGRFPDLKTLHLEKMSKLKCLDRDFYGAPINGFGCFRSLESLLLVDMAELQEWEELGVNMLFCLRELKILNCPKLKSLPSLYHLASLVDLQAEECTSLCSLPELPTSVESLTIRNCDLVRIRCEVGGEDWSTVEHISNVLIDGVKMATSPTQCIHPPYAEYHNTYLQGFQYIVEGVKSVFVSRLF